MLPALRRQFVVTVRLFSGKSSQKVVGSSIGPKFTSDKEVEEFLGKSTWNVRDYVPTSVDQKLIPSEETVVKLLKISGLPIENIDQIQVRLANQLSFINRLHSLPVDEDINPNHARIIERNPKGLDYKSLMDRVKNQEKSQALGELSGSWDSTKSAAVKLHGFFILKEGLLKGRN
ncbi:unnamed protein product [Kluyveromyces dobzhanskii CBS 2104]|uniref:Glutamyl-tRNA(Gln) amidotransferase subunit F, mitochondrial n=1 Tax=Kluyveromyces dobzhanskii CBS 2104 TaxID=1427455 RepID=A0A0A8L732_9SACH|nr:unnamed protein product [Kluyveromyces dobzhanskii CBS 2104]